MNYNKTSNELKKIKKELEISISDFCNNQVFQKNWNIYLKEDKKIIFQKWKKIKWLFIRLKKIIKLYNFNLFSDNYLNNFLIKRFAVVCYYNSSIKLQSWFKNHEEFIRTFLNDRFRENYSSIARFIYNHNFLFYLNYPKEFIFVSKDKIHKSLKWLVNEEIDYSIKLEFDYKNIYYYLRFWIDKIIYFIAKIWWAILSRLHIRSSDIWLIKDENIDKLYSELKPWDILLTRQNYVWTNLSIPWFWKHVSMYIWTWNFVRKNLWWKIIKTLNKDKHYIIESTSKWVKIDELHSFCLSKDYLWILRTTFSNNKIIRAIQETIDNIDSEYDYLFNYYSDKQFICSELITKAYLKDYSDDEWLSIELQKIGSILTYPPNELVRKAFKEKDNKEKELIPIFFIDNNLETWDNFINTKEELLNSYTRSSFSFLLK